MTAESEPEREQRRLAHAVLAPGRLPDQLDLALGHLSLLVELDAVVADHGGRLYLAKDARAGAASLRGYPHLDRLRAVRDRVDPGRRFRSLQSERLGL